MERIVGFTIEGVFHPSTGKEVAFVTPYNPDGLLASLFEPLTGWSPVIGVQPQGGALDTTIEPYRVRERYSSYTFSLAATDFIGGLLFRKARRAIGRLASPLDESATAVDFGISDLDVGPFDVEDLDGVSHNAIFIGEECIFVPEASEGSAGIYSGCLRGMAGTAALPHSVQKPFFVLMNEWQGRRVQIFDFTLQNQLRIRDVGKIVDSFLQSGPVIKVSIRSHLAGLDSQTINHDPAEIDGVEGLILSPEEGNGQSIGGLLTFESRVIKPEQVIRTAYVQIGRTVRQCFFGEAGETYDLSNEVAILDSPPIDEDTEVDPDLVAELFVVAGPDVVHPSTEGFSALTVTDRPALKEAYKRHPVAIAAALLFSTPSPAVNADRFDVLHPNMSLQAWRAVSDESLATIHALIERTADRQVDQFIVGYDLETPNIMRRIRDMLQFWGFKIAVNDEGYVEFYELRTASIFDVASGFSINAVPSDLLDKDDGSGDRTSVIEGTFGGNPWTDARPLRVNSDDQTDVSPAARQRMEAQDLAVTGDTMSRGRVIDMELLMSARALLQNWQSPRLRFRAPDFVPGEKSYAHGRYLRLENLPLRYAWLFSFDGRRVRADSSIAAWTGQVIGRRYLPLENAYEVELIFNTSAPGRWRAPSGVVEEVSGAEVIIGVDEFGDTVDDPDRFFSGDQVVAYNLDGEPIAGPQTIANVTSTGFVLDAAFSPAPPAGSVVELADLDETGEGSGYFNPSLDGNYPGVDRAYVFFADDNNELGTKGLPGDEYGV